MLRLVAGGFAAHDQRRGSGGKPERRPGWGDVARFHQDFADGAGHGRRQRRAAVQELCEAVHLRLRRLCLQIPQLLPGNLALYIRGSGLGLGRPAGGRLRARLHGLQLRLQSERLQRCLLFFQDAPQRFPVILGEHVARLHFLPGADADPGDGQPRLRRHGTLFLRLDYPAKRHDVGERARQRAAAFHHRQQQRVRRTADQR